ncbi:MAG: FHA domain-containing protein [Methylococcales bacterium]|nr:FHA domain-containing protein [Methylococcales bacterium]MCK5478970.1 FHA domain-containing protein [Methylococcales bacterium]
MAKFTVYFKGKAIQSKIFDSGVIHIGRDETNDLVIDNLAIAPAHAVVIIKEDSCIIKPLNDEFPLVVNDEKSKESLLKNNDKIEIGKHTIVFNTTESIAPNHNNTFNKDVISLNSKLEEEVHIPDANLQVMDGQHIGRVLPLKKSMTRFGNSGSGIIIITRRKDGYFISSLESNSNITVNKEPLADKTINLSNNDILVIDNTSMQFFFEN